MFTFFRKIKARREIKTLRSEFKQAQHQLTNTRFEYTKVRQRIEKAEADLEIENLSDEEREFNAILITALNVFLLSSEKMINELTRKVLSLRVTLSYTEEILEVLARA